jgi:DNA primase
LTFRRYLIDEKIRSLLEGSKTTEEGEDASEFLEDVMQYQHLKKVLSKKLNRVL